MVAKTKPRKRFLRGGRKKNLGIVQLARLQQLILTFCLASSSYTSATRPRVTSRPTGQRTTHGCRFLGGLAVQAFLPLRLEDLLVNCSTHFLGSSLMADSRDAAIVCPTHEAIPIPCANFRRLHLALPLAPRLCACRGLLDPLGDHRAACATTGHCLPRPPARASSRPGLLGGWRSGRSQFAPCRHEPLHPRAWRAPDGDRLQRLSPMARGSACCGHHLRQPCHSLQRAAAGS